MLEDTRGVRATPMVFSTRPNMEFSGRRLQENASILFATLGSTLDTRTCSSLWWLWNFSKSPREGGLWILRLPSSQRTVADAHYGHLPLLRVRCGTRRTRGAVHRQVRSLFSCQLRSLDCVHG